MRFEWDERKNEENLRKHGFDFQDAPAIFDSPMRVWLDTREDYGEDRWVGLGLLRDVIVMIVYTEADRGETIRIISLRKAVKYERERYEEEVTY